MGSTLHDVVVDEARLGSVIIKSMIKDNVRAGTERWNDGLPHDKLLVRTASISAASCCWKQWNAAGLPEFTGDQKRDAHRHMLIATN